MADQQMLEERRRTWNGFVKLITISVAAISIIMILMALFLT